MYIDFLDIMLPGKALASTGYLVGDHPSIPLVRNGEIWICKGFVRDASGKAIGLAPWDMGVIRNDVITQVMTENIWSDPSTAKIYLRDGAPRFPRDIDYSPCQPPGVWGTGPDGKVEVIGPPATDYLIIGPGGIPTGVRASNHFCRCTVRGPYSGFPIGDLPAGEDWEAWYERGSSDGVIFPALEKKTFRRGYGPYKWEQLKWQQNAWVPDVNATTGKPIQSLTATIYASTEHLNLQPIQKIW